MKNRRLLYIWLVIILTILTVGVITNMRVDNTNTEIYDRYDKLDTNIKYGQKNSEMIYSSRL